ncbi:MAG: F0F1 ATP synthase subunit epsilon [Candidatus Entotheonella factor]|uniref:F0F1 ATP synthase subunit epsilon n=1 Tax=Entotheonella factor TaxID=1429438 RepID=W4LLL6_ENTF1|nr:F0F1 ATP synthase subunit epsilon [Candidatus Entotheonella palauensis]ETW98246.1 MAG: F0F1 ATP synthase subunit epsilon [Candidatus Entotheonella factor]
MRLKVITPTEVLIDTDVTKVIAEAENGAFCLLPRHVDFVATLVPSLLAFTSQTDTLQANPSQESRETVLAVDEGVLVKCGPEVMVSTRRAVQSPDLGQLRQAIEIEFRMLDEREAMARATLAKLEADTVRRFVKLGETVT